MENEKFNIVNILRGYSRNKESRPHFVSLVLKQLPDNGKGMSKIVAEAFNELEGDSPCDFRAIADRLCVKPEKNVLPKEDKKEVEVEDVAGDTDNEASKKEGRSSRKSKNN